MHVACCVFISCFGGRAFLYCFCPAPCIVYVFFLCSLWRWSVFSAIFNVKHDCFWTYRNRFNDPNYWCEDFNRRDKGGFNEFSERIKFNDNNKAHNDCIIQWSTAEWRHFPKCCTNDKLVRPSHFEIRGDLKLSCDNNVSTCHLDEVLDIISGYNLVLIARKLK